MGGGFKALADASAKNASFFFVLPYSSKDFFYPSRHFWLLLTSIFKGSYEIFHWKPSTPKHWQSLIINKIDLRIRVVLFVFYKKVFILIIYFRRMPVTSFSLKAGRTTGILVKHFFFSFFLVFSLKFLPTGGCYQNSKNFFELLKSQVINP